MNNDWFEEQGLINWTQACSFNDRMFLGERLNLPFFKAEIYYFCYNTLMKTKSLIETNPYLKDVAVRTKFIARSVRTSCGVEGIEPKNEKIFKFDIPRRGKKIYKNTKA
jgi:hypothetical protein